MNKLFGAIFFLLASVAIPCIAATPLFDVHRYGAVGDGKAMDTIAIQKTIDAACDAGGGTVLFPPGTYLSGTVNLKSHIKLQFEKGATLLGSQQRADYKKLNFYGLLLADKQEDIGICGPGTIDGNGKLLAADTERLAKEAKIPNAEEGHRPVIINFRECRNVTVRDITLRDSACWVQEYRDCEYVTIESITVRSNAVRNNDGIDIDGCSHVVVRGCDVDSEDDGICLKSQTKACEDVLVENCRIRSSCNALKFGTGSVVGFKNITCRNLEIYETYQSGIALEIVDGGTMDNVSISNIKITGCNNPLFIRLGHRNVKGAVGTVRGIRISDVTAEIPRRAADSSDKYLDYWKHRVRHSLLTGSIIGLKGHPVRDVKLSNVTFKYGGIGDKPNPKHIGIDSLTQVPELESTYPDASRFGTLPSWGLYCRHAEGLQFENVTLQAEGADYRAALVCDDVKNVSLDGFHVLSAGTAPIIVLNDVYGATIRDSVAPPKAVRFIQPMGNTADVNQQ